MTILSLMGPSDCVMNLIYFGLDSPWRNSFSWLSSSLALVPRNTFAVILMEGCRDMSRDRPPSLPEGSLGRPETAKDMSDNN